MKSSCREAFLARTFRRVFFIAMAAALSSCTYQSEVHETETAIPEASSNPPTLEARCKPGAPVVGLGPATDARPTQVIARYMEKTWLDYAWRVPVPSPHEVTIGAELGEHTSDVLANCLTAKGYCVQRDPHSLLVSGPARLVAVVLLSADTKNTSSWTTGSPLSQNRAAEIKVEVRDSSGSNVVFLRNYSSADAMENPPFSRLLLGDLNAWYLREVNKAIDDAVQKACDDPAFIAAIAPPSGPKPR